MIWQRHSRTGMRQEIFATTWLSRKKFCTQIKVGLQYQNTPPPQEKKSLINIILYCTILISIITTDVLLQVSLARISFALICTCSQWYEWNTTYQLWFIVWQLLATVQLRCKYIQIVFNRDGRLILITSFIRPHAK